MARSDSSTVLIAKQSGGIASPVMLTRAFHAAHISQSAGTFGHGATLSLDSGARPAFTIYQGKQGLMD